MDKPPLLLPDVTERYPLMIAARYKNTELAFVVNKSDLNDDSMLTQNIIALRDNILKEEGSK